MVAVTRTTREQWVDEGLRALASGGPGAVRVEALAASLGVTKGGFYGQFAGREALLAAMLDTWERESTHDVRQRVEAEGGDARRKLRRAGLLTFSSDRLLPVDLAVREWARRDDRVAARLRHVDEQRMGYLRELFTTIVGDDPDDPDAHVEVEARSLIAFCLAIGHHFLTADHGDLTRDEVLRRATRILETDEMPAEIPRRD
ncbi:MAG: TetR/AcrR family transcriptional regulator [Lapillicoccus sp.]